jgi:hypothetical protein
VSIYTIKNISGTELWSGEAGSIRNALEKANLARAYLARANLAGANLAGANLAGAKGIDYCVGGWALKYGWTCIRRPGQLATMRYGCEEHSLEGWTEELIVSLAAKHEPNEAERYAKATRGLVAWCRTVEALYPHSKAKE